MTDSNIPEYVQAALALGWTDIYFGISKAPITTQGPLHLAESLGFLVETWRGRPPTNQNPEMGVCGTTFRLGNSEVIPKSDSLYQGS